MVVWSETTSAAWEALFGTRLNPPQFLTQWKWLTLNFRQLLTSGRSLARKTARFSTNSNKTELKKIFLSVCVCGGGGGGWNKNKKQVKQKQKLQL